MNTIPEKIVGITGGSCSGKTELERNLQTKLPDRLSVLPFDDFFVGLYELDEDAVETWEDPALYRWDDLRRALHDLKQGKDTTIKANSRESVAAGMLYRTVEARPIVTVAGFLALYDEEVRSYYDDSIYVDLPEAEIVRRRQARAVPGDPWDADEYIHGPLLTGHRELVVPQRAFANHTVDGTLPRHELANRVQAIIVA